MSLGPLYVFLGEVSVQVLCPFFNWVVGAYTLYNGMDGTGEHYAKRNKPGGEGQIPYDLTFNWNIINRRKKQTKYNQRH